MKGVLFLILCIISLNVRSQEIFVPIRSQHFYTGGYSLDNLWIVKDTMIGNASAKVFHPKRFSYNQWNFGAIYSQEVGNIHLSGGVFTNSYNKPSVLLGVGIVQGYVRFDLFGAYGYPQAVIVPLYFLSFRKGMFGLSVNHQLVLMGLNFKIRKR